MFTVSTNIEIADKKNAHILLAVEQLYQSYTYILVQLYTFDHFHVVNPRNVRIQNPYTCTTSSVLRSTLPMLPSPSVYLDRPGNKANYLLNTKYIHTHSNCMVPHVDVRACMQYTKDTEDTFAGVLCA